MSLTVETGAGVTSADSYVTLVEANAWWAANGAPAAWTALDDAGKEARLRGAARYLQDAHRLPFLGSPLAWNQALVWPRKDATNFGQAVPSNVIPEPVKQAQLWLSIYGYSAGVIGGSPAVELGSNVKSTQVGPIAESFFSAKEMAEGQAAYLVSAPQDVVGLLYGLLDIGLLPTPGVVERQPPAFGGGAILVPSTILPDVTPDYWP